ncbi:MAG: Mrp/NBP35 family ATP-binding protein [Desulfobacteraceae bacterium]|nr:Mrp/NBP35 family ATP-binding protein [Desulfobacteraceae bacterium]
MNITGNNRKVAPKKNTDETPQVQALRESMSPIKHKFLVISSQAGVGKTSVIVNLAVALSKRGVRVGIMDVNYHGPDIHRMLGLEPSVAGVSDKPLMPIVYSDNLKVASIESVMQDIDETGIWGKPLKPPDILRFISSLNWGSLDYLFVDAPPSPGEGLLTVIRAIPEAEKIIVTAPNIIRRDRAKKMINFFTKEEITIAGWIENMRGFFCQHCDRRLELFSTGPGSRAVFLADIPFLGRIPIDPHFEKCADARKPSLEMYPESEVAEGCNSIIEKIMGGNKSSLAQNRPVY